ncbi:MAG: transposase [Phycisphaerales bacterium]
MESAFRPYEPDQHLLLPPSLREWLPGGHLSHFVSDTVDQLDLGPILSWYRGREQGNLPYHPAMMLKVLVYCYCTGTFSSRRIAKAIEDSVPVRFLAAGHAPDHRTICRFRERHLDAFQALFAQVVRIAAETGLVTLGTLAIDGTKIRADASKRKAMSHARMKEEEQRIGKEIAAIVAKAKGEDLAEDVQFGPDFRGDERRRKRRPPRVAADEDRRGKAAAGGAHEGRRRGEGGGGEAPQGRGRRRRLAAPPALRHARAEGAGELHRSRQSDHAGRKRRVSAVLQRGARGRLDREDRGGGGRAAVPVRPVDADPDDREVRAGGGRGRRRIADDDREDGAGRRRLLVRARTGGGGAREGTTGCLAVGREGKASRRPPDPDSARGRMAAMLRTEEGRKRYKERKHLAEPPIGWLKEAMGFRQFSLRGLRKVTGELNLVTMAMNLRRMATMAV